MEVTIAKTSSLTFTDGGSIAVTPGDDTNQISIGNLHGAVTVKSNGDTFSVDRGLLHVTTTRLRM